jgi:hypothetical protein
MCVGTGSRSFAGRLRGRSSGWLTGHCCPPQPFKQLDVFFVQAAPATNKRTQQRPNSEVEKGEDHAADPPNPLTPPQRHRYWRLSRLLCTAERLIAAGVSQPELEILRSALGVRFFMESSPHTEPSDQVREILHAVGLTPVGPITFGRTDEPSDLV